MSQFITDILKRANETRFNYKDGVLEISPAVLVFRNFSGNPNHFGNTSKNFNVVIPHWPVDESGLILTDFLQNSLVNRANEQLIPTIHKYPKDAAGTDDDPCFYYINIKVNMDTDYPPNIKLYTTNTRNGEKRISCTVLSDPKFQSTIGCLDKADLERADVQLNVRDSKANPGRAVFYLRKLNAKQICIPDFGGAYDELDAQIEANPEIMAANEEIMK